MDRSSRELSKRKREGAKGEKSASFPVFPGAEIKPMRNSCRIIVQNPATGQDLCTYALQLSQSAFSIVNSTQRDFSLTFRCTKRDPSRPFGV